MKTTLNQIKANHPCKDGYKKLLKFLGKTEADNEPLALSVILESNGLDDAIWCFRAVSSGYDKELWLFAIFCARQVQHLLTDPRSINAIDVAEQYVNGNATDAELTAASNAAYDASFDVDSAASFYAARAAGSAAAFYAAANAAAYSDADNAAYYARAADPNIMPVLESYLKNLLSEEK